MTDRVFRNHFTVVLDNMLSSMVLATVIVFFLVPNMPVVVMVPIWLFIFLVPTLVSVYVWRKTTVTFTDTEVITVKDTRLLRSEKRIQYTRLASIGVTRGFLNRILGTTRLQFNVNSSVNALTPETTLTLEMRLAESIRDKLNSLVFSKEITVESESGLESLVDISNMDIIRHALLSQPTPRLLFSVLMLAYSGVSVITNNTSGLIASLFLLAFSEIVPFVRVILKYYNYRIYRIGDTITVESGLITTQRSSFRIVKVNSLRMRQPLLARVFGLSTLEAEVVGLATTGNSDSTCPLLCPLKPKGTVTDLMGTLLPEVVFEPEPLHQTRGALMAMALMDIVYVGVILAVFVSGLFLAETYIAGISDTWRGIVTVTEAAVLLLVPLLIFGHCGMAQKHRTFAMGPESFRFVYGAYDIAEEYILYDKVQHTDVVAGPLQRLFGVARCKVSLMSSAGFAKVSSGLFPPGELERVPNEVMARIRDGRYDHRRYE